MKQNGAFPQTSGQISSRQLAGWEFPPMVIVTESPNALYNSGLGIIGNFCPDIFIHFVHTIYLHIRAILGLTKIKARICPQTSSPSGVFLPQAWHLMASPRQCVAAAMRQSYDAPLLWQESVLNWAVRLLRIVFGLAISRWWVGNWGKKP